jgi:hypothetical protein
MYSPPVLKETYAPQYPELLNTFRFVFATSISSCFSRINLARLGRWLDLSKEDVVGWCSNVGWEVEGDNAVVPKNGDNDVKAGVVKENVELSRGSNLQAGSDHADASARIDQVNRCRCIDSQHSTHMHDYICIHIGTPSHANPRSPVCHPSKSMFHVELAARKRSLRSISK